MHFESLKQGKNSLCQNQRKPDSAQSKRKNMVKRKPNDKRGIAGKICGRRL